MCGTDSLTVAIDLAGCLCVMCKRAALLMGSECKDGKARPLQMEEPGIIRGSAILVAQSS